MPTVFTHAVVGASLAPWAPRAVRGPRLALALATVSMLPDADVVGFGLGISYHHPLGHRGLSHAPVVAPLVGIALATAFRAVPRFSADWWRVALLGTLATASHGVLDAMTDGGLGVAFFLPMDGERYFLPWRPIPVSPIGSGFFSARGAAIVASEMRTLWVPALLLAAAPILAHGLARSGRFTRFRRMR